MKTNFQMLQELLKVYRPKKRGIICEDEFDLIKNMLCLDEMDVLALRNLRDFVVASMGQSENAEDYDRISAITYCIDHSIFHLGGNV